jgi:hypothetical protein
MKNLKNSRYNSVISLSFALSTTIYYTILTVYIYMLHYPPTIGFQICGNIHYYTHTHVLFKQLFMKSCTIRTIHSGHINVERRVEVHLIRLLFHHATATFMHHHMCFLHRVIVQCPSKHHCYANTFVGAKIFPFQYVPGEDHNAETPCSINYPVRQRCILFHGFKLHDLLRVIHRTVEYNEVNEIRVLGCSNNAFDTTV